MKCFKRGEKGFTLIELLIVVAILGILAAVVIPNVVGLLGRGGEQAYKTDQEVIQLAAATFFADIHGGWDNDTLFWGDEGEENVTAHYFPTELARTASHYLVLSTDPLDDDPDNPGNSLIENANGSAITGADIQASCIWMGLMIHAPGDNANATGGADRLDVSPLTGENGLYLNELPESARAGTFTYNGGPSPGGGYAWVVGKNGKVFGAYSPDGDATWYNGFSGAYP